MDHGLVRVRAELVTVMEAVIAELLVFMAMILALLYRECQSPVSMV
jgi:hypothetical protein